MRDWSRSFGGTIAGGLIVLAVAKAVGWPALQLSARDVLLLLVLLPVVFVLLIAVHEGGHLAAGAAAGFAPSLFIAGPVRFERTGAGWRAGLNRSFPMYGGLAGATPRGAGRLRRRMTVVVAGGPAASLVAGVAALALLAARTPPSPRIAGAQAVAFLLAFVFGLGSLAIGATALVPSQGHGFASDGARIRRFLQNDPAVDGEVAMLGIVGASMAGQRPREWDASLVAMALQLPVATPFGAGARLIAHLHALDAGDIGAARAHLHAAIVHRTHLPAMSVPAVLLQAAFFAARHDRDAERARVYLDEASAELFGSPQARPLAEAAILVLERDPAAGAALAAAAHELPRALDRGAALMAADQIADLQLEVERA